MLLNQMISISNCVKYVYPIKVGHLWSSTQSYISKGSKYATLWVTDVSSKEAHASTLYWKILY